MDKRALGSTGVSVSAIGLGCMGMSQSYGVPDDEESVATLRRALDLPAGVALAVVGLAAAGWIERRTGPD